MPRSKQEQQAWEQQAYGMTWEEVLKQVPEHYRASGYDCKSVAMSMLSDIQHQNLEGEALRQRLNIVKAFMTLSCDKFTALLSEVTGKDAETVYLENRCKYVEAAEF